MLGLIKKVLFTLLAFSGSIVSMTNDSNLTTCVSLNNQPCMTRLTLIYLNPEEHNHGLGYHKFMVNLDRCNGSCNTLDNPSDKICLGVIHKGCPDKFGNFWDPPPPFQACAHLVDHPPARADTRLALFEILQLV